MTLLPHRRELIFVKFTPHNTLLRTLLLYLVFFFKFCFLTIVAPVITTQPQVGPVTEGDNVTLFCNASGNPVPTITWTRNGSVLTSSVARISFEAESRELTITSINRTDSGEYRCAANNSEGNVTSDAATLDVQCEYTSCPFEYDMTDKTRASVVKSGLQLYIGSLADEHGLNLIVC